MDIIKEIRNKAKKANKIIVFPETNDPRILEATQEILKHKLAKIILIGDSGVGKKALFRFSWQHWQLFV